MKSRRIRLGIAAILAGTSFASSSQQSSVDNSGTDEIVVATADSSQGGEDWPRFLGPRRDGTSSETGFLTEWSEDGPPVLWERHIGEGYGAPVISKGKLIFFHRIDDHEVIECVNAEDASQVFWTQRYPTTYVDDYGSNNGPRSSPTIDGEHVYTYGAQGMLTCVDFQTGSVLWQRQVNKEYRVHKGFFGAGSAPVIDDNLLLLNVGGPGAGIVAFDKISGETVWKTSDDEASYSTPIIATVHGERLALFHTADGFLAVETKTGKVQYRYPFRSPAAASAIAATPVLLDDIVFLSGSYQIGAVALKLTPDGLQEVWRSPTAMQSHWATSVYHEGYLYGVTGRHEQGSKLRCIEFLTGKVVWTADRGISRASYVMAAGYLIAVGERGEFALIKVTPEGYTEKSRAKVMRYQVRTPPVLSHGLVYIRSERKLKCLDLRIAP
ncbi:MAG TPA: alcohol dehydrogenase [Candidatus Hydrogenedentes bacterium]|nr:alcohol dehydrogenase [Candidatus Hydrogenedentota bacterium]